MTSPPTVAVVICTKDRPDELRRCLASVVSIRDQVREILVVDNGSATDETRRVAENAKVACVREERRGLSAARNRALAEVTSDIVAFTDDDCEPTREWIPALIAAFDDERVGCVTGRTSLAPGADRMQRVVADYLLGPRAASPRAIRPQDLRGVYTRGIAGVGANMAFRLSAIRTTGGFPEIFESSGDDAYMFVAILRAGYEIRYEPAAVVVQRHRDTLSSQAARTFAYGRNTIVLFEYLATVEGGRYDFARNVLHAAAARLLVATRYLIRLQLAQVVLSAAQIAGMIAGTITAPAKLPPIRREIGARRAAAAEWRS
jgi:glycosyltransferase involved in cell wall biosynthesis